MREKRELSRAEVARQRRAQRAANELTQTSKRAVKPIIQPAPRRTAPPPKISFVQAQKKNRFNIALGFPDFHLKRPALKSAAGRERKWRVASSVIAILFGALIFLALIHPYFNIPSVTVLGNNRLTREEISNATGALGQSIFTVQPAEVEAQLRLTFPELLTADAAVYLPNHLYVTVEEREPVILWQQEESYAWIDMHGVAFRPRGVVEGLVPVVGLTNPPQGISADPLTPPSYMQPDLAEAILALAPSVPLDTIMIYDRNYGLGWRDTRGWNVYFGTDTRNMELKVRVYEALARSLSERNISPVFVNVAHPEAPYYRMAAEVEFKPVAEGATR